MPRISPLVREDPRMADIKSQIGSIKAKHGLTDAELAKKIGISTSALSRMIGKGGDVGKMRLCQFWQILDLDKGG